VGVAGRTVRVGVRAVGSAVSVEGSAVGVGAPQAVSRIKISQPAISFRVADLLE
jgi:hypothetical protein